ncbi:TPA: hypothetical protein ACSQZ9_006322, partial [Pseudomonas aeruginosa]
RMVLATCNFTSGRGKLRPAFHRRFGNALSHSDEGRSIFFLHKRHALQYGDLVGAEGRPGQRLWAM